MHATNLNILCAGAAQGLVKTLEQRFTDATGVHLQGRFGAVGAMRDALLAGERCDVMISTQAIVDAMTERGELLIDGQTPLGRVRTGIAVRDGDPLPDIGTPEALRSALLAADGLYYPDPQQATAGIHFAAVLQMLGIADQMRARTQNFPNGATAMRELAAAQTPQPIGCTQLTEIMATEGVSAVGPLPKEFELLTVYTAAVTVCAADPAVAEQFVALLTGAETRQERAQAGFETL